MKKGKDFIWDTGWTMNRFSRMVQEVSGRFPEVPQSAGETSEPAVDVFEDDSDWIINVEAPDLSRDDLRVRLEEDHICIEGYKKRHEIATHHSYICLERQYGVFRRVVKIPGSVDTHSIRAILRDGVLRIKLKKISDRRKPVLEVKIDD